MAPKTVLLIGALTHCQKEWKELSSKYTLKEYLDGDREKFVAQLQNHEYDDVVGICRSNSSTAITGPFDTELVALLPKSLKFICHNGAGYDNVNVEACSERGIQISSTPIAVDGATADVAIFLMLGALRKVTVPMTAIREGKFRGDTTIGNDPKDKTLGILGMGGIGRAMAHRARGFGMKIAYHNRTRLSPDLEGDATYLTFAELLAKSDILSLNLSLNEKTRHIISAPEFEQMKKGVIIINTARGALMNESHLADAVDSGKVASVGLDVYENEPEVEARLMKNPNVVLLPHIGTNTYETQRDMELLVLQNLESAFDKGDLLTLVQEQKR